MIQLVVLTKTSIKRVLLLKFVSYTTRSLLMRTEQLWILPLLVYLFNIT